MSKKAIDYKVILRRDGQTQQQRMPQLLDPALVPVDQRSKEDLYKYLQTLAKQVKFFELDQTTNRVVENGTWETFFSLPIDELTERASNAALPAHIALWDTFVEVLEQPKKLLNNLTKRHLDFYYQDVLRLEKKKPIPDQAHVLFELKRNTENTLLTAGTLLLAGKDNLKKTLHYKLTHDIVVNKSRVVQLKSLFVNPANKNFLHHAPFANSADGLGAVLPATNPKWKGFGSVVHPLAQVGFCLATDVLLMKEGNRKVTVNLTLRKLDIAAKNPTLTANLFKVSITGDKGWIGPKAASALATSADNDIFNLAVTFYVSMEEPAVVAYNKSVHGGDFDTFHPVLQLLINNEKTDFGYSNLISTELIDAIIEVEATGITALHLENDFGTLNPKKPFTPFGSLSDKNSNFYIQYEEAFSKRLKEFSLEVDWKNIPDSDLARYYVHYNQPGNGNTDFTATAAFKDGYSWKEQHKTVQLFNTSNAQSSTTWKFTNPAFPVKLPFLAISNFISPLSINPGNTVQQALSSTVSYLLPQFSAIQPKANLSQTKLSVGKTKLFKPALHQLFNVYKDIRKGQFQLRLNHSFLFKEYREKYATEIMRFSQDGGVLKLPAEPFAPEIQSIILSYTATTAKINFNSTNLSDYVNEEIEFFQFGAFGQMREHAYTRSKYKFLNNNLVKLVPEYTQEGNLLIGFSDLNAADSVCILFQVAEGSANPQKPKVTGEWSVLCDNYWKSLNNDDFIFDTTNDLLKSGVVKIVIPKEATTTNSLLPSGLLWLKISIPRDSDGVCELLDIQSNAAIVVFEDQDNDPTHLQKPLPPNTIAKLENDNAKIKKVSQPYSSFGGRMLEGDETFYIRSSERLRHKERCIALWDYERLILQHFPSVHKAKCINHATSSSFYAPGNVLIVVVPDLTNRNAVDLFQPKVDKNTLDEIYDFVTRRSTPWAQFQIINPLYEPVKIAVKLKLKRGYEFNYYEKVLNEKLQQFLSPWVGDSSSGIHFGGKVTKSMVIKFLEDLEFVDYLTALSLYKSSPGMVNVEVAEASNPASILVSATQHSIESE
jgi:hypothetical protein